MRFIRFDSVGGASGDMILAALFGLGVDPTAVEECLRGAVRDEFRIRTEIVHSCGVSGTRVTVEIPDFADTHLSCSARHSHHLHVQEGHSHHRDAASADFPDRHSAACHSHRTFSDIRRIIEGSSLVQGIKTDAVAVFSALAKAEGTVHGKPSEEVSFHEVGATDSIVDILGAVIGFHSLGIDSISIGPIPVGRGTVHCMHGVYPVPAPAVAQLLETYEIPVALDGGEGEMLTPTGAVLLGWWKKVPDSQLQAARLLKSANALGHRQFSDRPNLLRASLYETADITEIDPVREKWESLLRLDANLDDVSSEVLAHASDLLFQAGALDVWFTPIQMKKGRPALMMSVLTTPEKRDEHLEMVFRQTGTFGVREEQVSRCALGRRFSRVKTAGGEVTVKSGFFQGEEIHFAPEFDDCAAAAASARTTALQIYREAVAAYQSGRVLGDGADSEQQEITDGRE